MTKAHEQEWWPAEFDWRVVVNDEDGAVIADVRVPPQDDGKSASALVASAPNMARALLAFLPERGHTLECGNVTGDDAQCSDECRNGRAALRKAGVL